MPDKPSIKILIALCLLASLLGLSRFAEHAHPRYDAGAYIIAAQSFSQGMGLKHLAHPENPPFTTYPPVIPIMLSPFASFAKEGFVGLKIGMVLIYAATLFAFAITFRRFLSGNKIYFALALLASGSLLAFAGRLQGEVPFTLFGLLTIYFADRFVEQYKFADLAGMLASLSLLCNSRQAGIAWVAGILLVLLLAPKRLPVFKKEVIYRITAAVLLIVLIALPWALLIHSIQPGSLTPDSASVLRTDGWDPDKGQIGLLSRAMIGRLKMNLFASATFAPESLFYAYELSAKRWTIALFLPLFALMLAGFIYRAIKKRSVLEGVTVAYCGLIFITPWLTEPRFFTVILPLLIVYLFEGAKLVVSLFTKDETEAIASKTFATICILIFAVNIISVATDNHVNKWSAKGHEDHELAMFAKGKLPADTVVLAHDHCAFYLLTGYKSLSFTASEQKFLARYKLPSYLAKGGRADAIAWTEKDRKLVESFLKAYGYDTTPIAQKGGFYLQKLTKPPNM